MKKRRKLVSVVICIALLMSSLGLTSTVVAETKSDTDAMAEVVKTLGEHMDGEKAFDYLSYVYLGWRTTGGKWQNQVIDSFITRELENAGYTDAGKGTTLLGSKSANDKSSDATDDFSWITYYDVNTNTWDPEYAKLEVTAPSVSGAKGLINRINVESAGFDPTSDTYLKYYDDEYGNINSIDDMWSWVTKKNNKGERTNVINGEEAKLNQRVHLAWNSAFTDPKGTDPESANGVTGEAVYIGAVSGSGSNRYCTKYPTAAESNAKLAGKVLLSDTSLSTTFTFAQQVGAVAVMSTSSLSNYNLPQDEHGDLVSPFEKSARYATGSSLANSLSSMDSGKPIVCWQFSTDQKNALKELLEKSEGKGPVTVKNISIGDIYAMNDSSKGGKGQAVAMAEIKGDSKPNERILVCAHVQEPSANDNATGAGAMLEMATKLKKMVDNGEIDRPERTITFLWGDEMNLATYWLNSHPDEKDKLVAALDMDMVGEDPEKTGGVMRIEKTPDPSATYNYTLDELYWEDNPSYDATYKDSSGNFVRLPDSHTLWGAGGTSGLFNTGFYLNDLYMDAAQNVITHHDKDFQVDVCPYEGGSDHSRFLQQNVPALLTWHFTDYTYHTSVDTLNMSSAREMENVNITTAATAFMMANTVNNNEDLAKEIMEKTYAAALERFDTEKENTDHHITYIEKNNKSFTTELAQEKVVLNAWGKWYKEAIASVADSLLTSKSDAYKALEEKYVEGIEKRLDEAINYADKEVQPTYNIKFETTGGDQVDSLTKKQGKVGKLPTPVREGYDFDGWYRNNVLIEEDTVIEENWTLAAKWTKKTDVKTTFTINFESAGGNDIASVTKDAGAVGALPEPTREGYDFNGWYRNNILIDANTVIDQDWTLAAKWTKKTEVKTTFTVKFETAGGNTIESITREVGPVGELPTPVREGYSFDGWHRDNALVGATTVISEDWTLVAKWTKRTEVQTIFTINFESTGGDAIATVMKDAGPIGELPTPTRAGYLFEGWYYNNTLVTPHTVVDRDMALAAQWTKQAEVQTIFTIKFETAGGEVINTTTREKGAVGKLPEPTRAGYEFNGWYRDNALVNENTVIDEDWVLVAKWTKSIDMSTATISGIKSQVYNGKAKTPTPVVKLGSIVLKKDVDYTVSYGKNTAIGKGSVTITGKGDYKGKKTLTFKILPKSSSISNIKVGKKQVTVKWKKSSGATKYQIQYKQKGTSKWKTKTVSTSKSSLTIKSLRKGKVYQVKVRACKTVSKVNYYSAWSKVKSSSKIK